MPLRVFCSSSPDSDGILRIAVKRSIVDKNGKERHQSMVIELAQVKDPETSRRRTARRSSSPTPNAGSPRARSSWCRRVPGSRFRRSIWRSSAATCSCCGRRSSMPPPSERPTGRTSSHSAGMERRRFPVHRLPRPRCHPPPRRKNEVDGIAVGFSPSDRHDSLDRDACPVTRFRIVRIGNLSAVPSLELPMTTLATLFMTALLAVPAPDAKDNAPAPEPTGPAPRLTFAKAEADGKIFCTVRRRVGQGRRPGGIGDSGMGRIELEGCEGSRHHHPRGEEDRPRRRPEEDRRRRLRRPPRRRQGDLAGLPADVPSRRHRSHVAGSSSTSSPAPTSAAASGSESNGGILPVCPRSGP